MFGQLKKILSVTSYILVWKKSFDLSMSYFCPLHTVSCTSVLSSLYCLQCLLAFAFIFPQTSGHWEILKENKTKLFDIYHTEALYCICTFFETTWSFLHPVDIHWLQESHMDDGSYSHYLIAWQRTDFLRRNWISITFVSLWIKTSTLFAVTMDMTYFLIPFLLQTEE